MELNVPSQFGRYHVQVKLGNGAFGTVYKAWDSHLETYVALKIPHVENLSSERRTHILARFHREAKAAARLPPNSNICPIRDHGEIEGQPYVTMAFLDGHPLSKVRKPQPVPTTLRTVRRIARAMQVAHDHAVIHRDLKPDNIMIVDGDQPVVMDFGLARRLDSEESLQTADGTVMGTPAYMSPEQAGGKQDEICPQSDVYSLGVICYELLTGRRPFEAESVLALLTKIATGTPAPPSRLNPEIDAELDAICLRAITRNREIRYASMLELDEALADYSDSSRGRKRRASSRLRRESVRAQFPPTTDLTPAEMFPELAETGSYVEIDSTGVAPLTEEDPDQPTLSNDSLSTSGMETMLIKLDQTDREAIRPRPRKPPWRHSKRMTATSSALVLLLAGIVFLFQTKQGAIRVEIHDPEIEVAIKGTEIVLKQADKGKSVKLFPGEKTLIVQRGDFTFETDTLILKKGETVTVRVELLDGQIEVHQGEKRIGRRRFSEPTPPSKAEPKEPEHDPPKRDSIPPSNPALLIAPFNPSTARETQQAWAKFLGTSGFVLTNSIGMKLALIPPGEFLMGSGQSAAEVARIAGTEPELFTREHPQHRVRITQPFYLGMYEVTQSEWEKVMGSNPSHFSAIGSGIDKVSGMNTARFPVEKVSWYDAVEYCNKLSERGGLATYYRIADVERTEGKITKATVSIIAGGNGYRLPTEAEWEYACRGGTTTPFHFGTNNNGQAANINGNYPYGTETKVPYLARTVTVGAYAANAFGLFDMHGNVWEWCFDGHDENEYQNRTSTTNDPVNTIVHDARVLRGGSWVNGARFSRSAGRDWFYPDGRVLNYGFRVARTPEL